MKEREGALVAASSRSFTIVAAVAFAAFLRQSPPALTLGSFEDDYKSTHVITAEEWRHGRAARYRIVKWNVAEQYLIAQNDANNPSDPKLWTRIDWMPLPTEMAPYTWAFCMSAYKAASAEEAEKAAIARRQTPRTGCNGFPFTRMKEAGK